jgi:uncharacterized protein
MGKRKRYEPGTFC